MSNQEDMDKVLDEMEEKLPDEETEEVSDLKEEEENPPGFMGYDEWIAAGKDPKKFRGEDAYKDHYETLQEVKDLKSSVTSIADGMASWKETQRKQENERIDQAVAEAKAQLAKAKEEEDVSAALEAERAITALNEKSKANEDPDYTPNPVLVAFQGKHPIVDKSSSQFNQEFHDDMAMIQGTILDKLTGGTPEKIAALTEGQIQRSLDLAYREAKGLHPDKFTSPKNTRKSTPPSKKKVASTGDLRSRLKGVGGGGLNKNDNNPAVDMYDLLKKKSQKAADEYANRILGETA